MEQRIGVQLLGRQLSYIQVLWKAVSQAKPRTTALKRNQIFSNGRRRGPRPMVALAAS